MRQEPPVQQALPELRVQVGLAERSALSELLLSLARLQRQGRLPLPLEPAQRLVLERPPSSVQLPPEQPLPPVQPAQARKLQQSELRNLQILLSA